MLGKEGTPLRAMAAYAFAVRTLAFQQFIADLRCDDPALLRARVFIRGEKALIVLYTGNAKAGAVVHLDIAPRNVLGIDGRILPVTTPGQIPIPDGLSYVVADLRAVIPKLRSNGTTLALNITAHKAPSPRGDPSPVILSYLPRTDGAGAIPSSTQGYWVSGTAVQQFPVNVRLSDLSETPHQVALHWQVLVADATVPVDGPTATVPPFGTTNVAWTADLSPLAGITGQGLLADQCDVRGGDPGHHPARHSADQRKGAALLAGRLPGMHAAGADRAAKMAAPGRADAHLHMSITPDKHWLLTVTFGKSDPWAYPQLTLPEKGAANYHGLVLRAKCANPASTRVILWQADGSAFVTNYPAIPADGHWHTAALDFSTFIPLIGTPAGGGQLIPEKITKIALGLNSPSAQNSLEVSDVYLVRE